MPWRIYCVFLAVWCLGGYTNATIDGPQDFGVESFWTKYHSLHNQGKHSDITFDKEPVEPAAGSGGWMFHDTDDEDLIESGSGSGSGMGELVPEGSLNKTTLMTTAVTTMTTASTTTTTTTTTIRPPTPCEKQRQASRQLSSKYIPRCLPNGEFSSLQCRNHPLDGDCWCSDLDGAEIPGTSLEGSRVPNCETGENLSTCTHQLVLHVRSKLLGNFRPHCTTDGDFERIQCHGSMCFCVEEKTGSRVSGTEVHIPDTPNCDDDSVDVIVPESTTSSTTVQDLKDNNEEAIDIDETVDEPNNTLPPEIADTIDLDMDIGSNNDKNKEIENAKPKFSEDNKSNKDTEEEIYKSEQESHQGDKVERASEIMTQPGILAGIIGGSVVLLLCVVLLVMFVVYRMRKKDEGSYPLDEPRKTPNYNYVRAPEKEFYA